MAKFCIECGSALSEEQAFCEKCGTKYNPATTSEHQKQESVTTISPLPKEPSKNMTRKQKVLLVTIVAVVICGAIGHTIIKGLTASEKKTVAFLNGLTDVDEAVVYNNLSIPDGISYDKKQYISYLKEQDMYAFKENVTETVRSVELDGITRIVKHENGSDLLLIKEKKWLSLYPTIDIIPVSTEVMIATDIKDAKIQFNGKKYDLKGKDISLKKFLPGSYKIKATTENAIIPHTAKWNVDVTTNKEKNTIILLQEYLMVTLDNEYSDSVLFVNGKSTNKTISELKEIGPFFGETTAKLTIQKENEDGAVAISDEEIVYAGQLADFSYPSEYSFILKSKAEIAEEYFNEDVVNRFIDQFRYAYESALNNKDYELITDFFAPNAVAGKEIKDVISGIGDEYYHYNFTSNELKDLKVDSNNGTAKTYEEFYFTDDQSKTTLYQRDKTYNIALDNEGNLKIDTISIDNTRRTPAN